MIRRSGPPTSDLRCPNIEPEGITLTLTLACAAQKYQIFGSKKFRTQNIKIKTQNIKIKTQNSVSRTGSGWWFHKKSTNNVEYPTFHSSKNKLFPIITDPW